jgi:Tfp pilus assembly protein PilN
MLALITTITTFFGGLWGKVVLYGSIAAIVLAVIGFLIYDIRKNAAHDQLLTDQNAQLQQVIADQKRFDQQTAALQAAADASNDALSKQIKANDDTAAAIKKFLSSPKIKATDRPASVILQQTLDQIEKNKLNQ